MVRTICLAYVALFLGCASEVDQLRESQDDECYPHLVNVPSGCEQPRCDDDLKLLQCEGGLSAHYPCPEDSSMILDGQSLFCGLKTDQCLRDNRFDFPELLCRDGFYPAHPHPRLDSGYTERCNVQGEPQLRFLCRHAPVRICRNLDLEPFSSKLNERIRDQLTLAVNRLGIIYGEFGGPSHPGASRIVSECCPAVLEETAAPRLKLSARLSNRHSFIDATIHCELRKGANGRYEIERCSADFQSISHDQTNLENCQKLAQRGEVENCPPSVALPHGCYDPHCVPDRSISAKCIVGESLLNRESAYPCPDTSKLAFLRGQMFCATYTDANPCPSDSASEFVSLLCPDGYFPVDPHNDAGRNITNVEKCDRYETGEPRVKFLCRLKPSAHSTCANLDLDFIRSQHPNLKEALLAAVKASRVDFGHDGGPNNVVPELVSECCPYFYPNDDSIGVLVRLTNRHTIVDRWFRCAWQPGKAVTGCRPATNEEVNKDGDRAAGYAPLNAQGIEKCKCDANFLNVFPNYANECGGNCERKEDPLFEGSVACCMRLEESLDKCHREAKIFG